MFGAIGGLAGGISSAWWQIKGGAPSEPTYKGQPPVDKLTPQEGSITNPRWRFPFLKPDKSKIRYLERQQRVRDRRMKQR